MTRTLKAVRRPGHGLNLGPPRAGPAALIRAPVPWPYTTDRALAPQTRLRSKNLHIIVAVIAQAIGAFKLSAGSLRPLAVGSLCA